MSSPARLLAAALLLAAACAGQAAPDAPRDAAAAPPGTAASDSAHAEPLRRTVIEDDLARIEETRLRGEPQRIRVQSKVGGVAGYEILVAPPGRDASLGRGIAGQRAWSVLSF